MVDSTRKRPKRPNGSGCLYLRKDGRWQAEWHEDTPAGKKRRTVYAQTKEAAEQKMRLARGLPLVEDLAADDGNTVYFIQSVIGGPIKIGRSGNLHRRLANLQACCPFPLRILHHIPYGGHKLERELHQRFAPYRLHSEWFDNVAPILSYIHELKSRKEPS